MWLELDVIQLMIRKLKDATWILPFVAGFPLSLIFGVFYDYAGTHAPAYRFTVTS